MRILMLGNSFTFTNEMPQMLAALTGGEVVSHVRGGALYAADGVHPSELGSRMAAETIADVIRRHKEAE